MTRWGEHPRPVCLILQEHVTNVVSCRAQANLRFLATAACTNNYGSNSNNNNCNNISNGSLAKNSATVKCVVLLGKCQKYHLGSPP